MAAARILMGGALKQAWTLTPSDTPQPNGNISALWSEGGGTVILTFADGTGPFTLTLAAKTLYTFPYAIQIVGASSGASGITAFGWGGPTTA